MKRATLTQTVDWLKELIRNRQLSYEVKVTRSRVIQQGESLDLDGLVHDPQEGRTALRCLIERELSVQVSNSVMKEALTFLDGELYEAGRTKALSRTTGGAA